MRSTYLINGHCSKNNWVGSLGVKSSFINKINYDNLELKFFGKLPVRRKYSIFLSKKVFFWQNFLFFDQNFDIWPKFRLLTKISILDQNYDFWPKFRFLAKISIFDENFEAPIFYLNINFWQKFRFFTKTLIFAQKFRFLTKTSIFDQNFILNQNLFMKISNF